VGRVQVHAACGHAGMRAAETVMDRTGKAYGEHGAPRGVQRCRRRRAQQLPWKLGGSQGQGDMQGQDMQGQDMQGQDMQGQAVTSMMQGHA